jgi:hypothetical protein
MNKTTSAAAVIAIAALLAACGGGRMGSTALPPQQGTMDEGAIAFQAIVPDAMPPHTAGLNLPAILGTFQSKYGVIGGYTQKVRSQVLAFPPGTKLVIKNLSKTVPHTFNVLSTKKFPANTSLLFTASGGNKLKVGYRTGILQPGQSKTVILAFPGRYYIGCAYHYGEKPHMRDVIVVKKGVAPGPQATAPPSSNPSSSPSSTPYTPPPGGGGYDPH